MKTLEVDLISRRVLYNPRYWFLYRLLWAVREKSQNNFQRKGNSVMKTLNWTLMANTVIILLLIWILITLTDMKSDIVPVRFTPFMDSSKSEEIALPEDARETEEGYTVSTITETTFRIPDEFNVVKLFDRMDEKWVVLRLEGDEWKESLPEEFKGEEALVIPLEEKLVCRYMGNERWIFWSVEHHGDLDKIKEIGPPPQEESVTEVTEHMFIIPPGFKFIKIYNTARGGHVFYRWDEQEMDWTDDILPTSLGEKAFTVPRHIDKFAMKISPGIWRAWRFIDGNIFGESNIFENG
jgi:hypothetical protein